MTAKDHNDPLKQVFSSRMAYTYTAFRQVALLYEDAADMGEQKYNELCETVATETHIHPEFLTLLTEIAAYDYLRAVVMTCGSRDIWERVLERERLSDRVKVIAGGRISNKYVVTPRVKANLVAHLQEQYKMRVIAFGDSPIDIRMLEQANKAIVVVGEESSRSKSMDTQLSKVINDGLRARQVLLPSTVSPRLDLIRLPQVSLSDPEFIENLLDRHRQSVRILETTDAAAAKLLMTPMRAANVKGPALRAAHQNVGLFLATKLGEFLGLEEYDIPHVQGHSDTGHRLLHEEHTLIVPLMRGGEPMAFGISEVFPLAPFHHAKEPEDIKRWHLYTNGNEIRTLILVDCKFHFRTREFLSH